MALAVASSHWPRDCSYAAIFKAAKITHPKCFYSYQIPVGSITWEKILSNIVDENCPLPLIKSLAFAVYGIKSSGNYFIY